MAERSDLSEGQEVRVFGTTRRAPESVPGWVRKVGRTLVQIERAGHYGLEKFYIESQQRHDETYGVGVWFRTLPQVAEHERVLRALETLRQHGLGPTGYGPHKATLAVLEAAAEAVLKATEDL